MKRLIYVAIFSLAMLGTNIADAASGPTVYRNARTEAEDIPYISGAVAFPQRSRPSIASFTRHSFRLQIPSGSNALSRLTINVPDGLKVDNQITLSDKAARAINAHISVNGSKVTIEFPQSIASGTRLNIDMNNVRILGVSNAWVYPVTAKFVGLDADIPLGVARFGIY